LAGNAMMNSLENSLIKIGVILPSSNTVVEPMVSRMLIDNQEVSVHYSRFAVKEIAAYKDAANQFELESMLAAAHLLADAEVDLIVYAATSGAWLGLETDREFCRAVKERFGINATTSILALLDALKEMQIVSYGLVAGYTQDLVEKALVNFSEKGLSCIAWRSFFISENSRLSLISELSIQEKANEVLSFRPDAIVTLGTNIWAAGLAAEMEQKHDIVVLDTISVTVWKCFKLLNLRTTNLQKWGKLF
jgi:maleate isomerase